MKCFN